MDSFLSESKVAERTHTHTTKTAENPTHVASEEKNKAPKEPEYQPGMGAVYSPHATTFRVWAPHADKIFLTGTFNNWHKTDLPLTHEGNGYWALAVEGVKPGQGYKYLIHNGKETLSKNDPCVREIDRKKEYSVVVDTHAFDWEGDDFEMPNWNELVIYELHVGSFFGKDNQPGTFETVIEKLPYLAALNVNALKVMPPAEFPGDVSWGYNPSYPYAVEQAYGGPTGLKKLIKAAHQHGLAVFIDVVYNHFGPMGMDLWQFDGWYENEGGGIYFYNDWRAQTPWGHTRPDYSRPEVRRYLVDNALMWLDEYRADGLRIDSVSHIRSQNGSHEPEKELPEGWQFLQELNHAVHERFPWKLTIAEDLMCNEWVTQPDQEGGAGFSSQWDCNFVNPIRRILTETTDEARSMADVRKAITFMYGTHAFNRIIYTESHDDVAEGSARVPVEIMPEDPNSWFAIKRAVLGMVLAATAPGIPMIFQGQEFACLDEFNFPENLPLDWQRAEQFGGIVRLVSDAFGLRRNLSGQSKGLSGQQVDVILEDETHKLLAYHRYLEGGPGDSVVVIANFSAEPVTGLTLPLPYPGVWKTLLNTDSQLYHPNFSNVGQPGIETASQEGEVAGSPGMIDIGPYSILILGKEV